jgi:hypothetical protein
MSHQYSTDRSLRYNEGKPDYSLIPIELLEEAARVLDCVFRLPHAAHKCVAGRRGSGP